MNITPLYPRLNRVLTKYISGLISFHRRSLAAGKIYWPAKERLQSNLFIVL